MVETGEADKIAGNEKIGAKLFYVLFSFTHKLFPFEPNKLVLV